MIITCLKKILKDKKKLKEKKSGKELDVMYVYMICLSRLRMLALF